MKNSIIILIFCFVLSMQCSQENPKNDDLVVIQPPKYQYKEPEISRKKEACGVALCCCCTVFCRVCECGCRICRDDEWTKICNGWSKMCRDDTRMCWKNVVGERYNMQKDDKKE